MAAKNTVGLGVSDDLHKATRLALPQRPAIGHERELAGFHLDALGLQLLFVFADPGHFGRGVNDPRNGIEIDMRFLPGDGFGHRHTLVFGFVRQHRTTHHIADGVDIGQICFAVIIHFDKATVSHFQPDCRRAQAIGIGYATDRDDELVAFELLRESLVVGVVDGNGGFFLRDFFNLHTELDI